MKRNQFLKALLGSALVLSTIFISSCGKDDKSPQDNSKMKVHFKFIGSEGVNIGTVVYYSGTNLVTNTAENKGATWSSPEVEVGKLYAIATANAIGPADNSTLKAQIIQDGKVIKETPVSTGKILTTNINLNN
ncbi:MAG: hypothetical protein ACI35V_12115 [Sphingobacterium composti]